MLQELLVEVETTFSFKLPRVDSKSRIIYPVLCLKDAFNYTNSLNYALFVWTLSV